MYDGVKYNTVKLSNGQIWMAQPMRYAPKGYTVSADPKEESHIWYPYTFVNEGAPAAIKANDVKALTDDASVEKYGYLYDFYAAANVKETANAICYLRTDTSCTHHHCKKYPRRPAEQGHDNRAPWQISDHLGHRYPRQDPLL